jgi:hypothetical protein
LTTRPIHPSIHPSIASKPPTSSPIRHTHRLAEPEWRAACTALGLGEAEAASLLGSLHSSIDSSSDSHSPVVQEEEGEEDREEMALRFVNGWLLAVARAAGAALVAGVCALGRLTPAGMQQVGGRVGQTRDVGLVGGG